MESDPAARRKVVLVTGGFGRMGTALINRLLGLGWNVRVLDRRESVARELQSLPEADHFHCDLSSSSPANHDALVSACRGADIIYHLAGTSYGHGSSYKRMLSLNLLPTQNLLSACSGANSGQSGHVTRVVFAGSTSVYGHGRPGEVLDERSATRPKSIYAKSKLLAEEAIKAAVEKDPSLKYTILRITAIYGKGYDESFFKIFRMLRSGKFRYLGDGKNHLTLVNIEDVVNGMVAVAESSRCENKTYNLTDGESHTVRGLIEAVSAEMGMEPPTKHAGRIIGKLLARFSGATSDELDFLFSDRVVSTDLIRRDAGFIPSVPITKGIHDLAARFADSEAQDKG